MPSLVTSRCDGTRSAGHNNEELPTPVRVMVLVASARVCAARSQCGPTRTCWGQRACVLPTCVPVQTYQRTCVGSSVRKTASSHVHHLHSLSLVFRTHSVLSRCFYHTIQNFPSMGVWLVGASAQSFSACVTVVSCDMATHLQPHLPLGILASVVRHVQSLSATPPTALWQRVNRFLVSCVSNFPNSSHSVDDQHPVTDDLNSRLEGGTRRRPSPGSASAPWPASSSDCFHHKAQPVASWPLS